MPPLLLTFLLSFYFEAVKRILRYLKATLGYGIRFRPITNVCLLAYSDDDWAGCLDDRRPQGLNIKPDAKPIKQAQRRFHPLLTKKMDKERNYRM